MENIENNDGGCLMKRQLSDESDAMGNSRFVTEHVIARMPVDRNALYYNMEHKNRGLALIFNHKIFEVGGLRPRHGTDVDAERLALRLDKLGFDVTVHQDLEYEKLRSYVTDAANFNHTDYDCFVMFVLSHGEMGVLYARDRAYKPENLWGQFSADVCPTLAGKPKLFFIQACQGDKLMAPVSMVNRTETDGMPNNTYRIPSQADFLVAYSTIPGYYSWRNTTRGSWFIQALCTELEESAYEHDLLTILTFVSRRVAIDYESNTPDTPHMHEQKQIPCVTTMLTRLIKFNKKGETLSNSPVASAQEVKVKESPSRTSLKDLNPFKKGNKVFINY